MKNIFLYVIKDNRELFDRFSKDGKFLNKIGCSGEGPEEYIRSLSFCCG